MPQGGEAGGERVYAEGELEAKIRDPIFEMLKGQGAVQAASATGS